MSRFKPPGDCPVCGEFVPRGQAACPSCGSCERSGWSDGTDYDGIDLPDDPSEFDYDEFIEREFGPQRGGRKTARHLWWWVAVVLFAVMAIALMMSLRR